MVLTTRSRLIVLTFLPSVGKAIYSRLRTSRGIVIVFALGSCLTVPTFLHLVGNANHSCHRTRREDTDCGVSVIPLNPLYIHTSCSRHSLLTLPDDCECC